MRLENFSWVDWDQTKVKVVKMFHWRLWFTVNITPLLPTSLLGTMFLTLCEFPLKATNTFNYSAILWKPCLWSRLKEIISQMSQKIVELKYSDHYSKNPTLYLWLEIKPKHFDLMSTTLRTTSIWPFQHE